MPLFATLIVACALTSNGKGAECDIAVHDKYQQVSQPVCFVQLERVRYKVANDLMVRLDVDELLPGSHNCFSTKAHRDSALNRVTIQFDKAGITYHIINKDK